MNITFNKKQTSLVKRFVSQFHNKEKVNLVAVFKAIVYIVRTGVQWHMLPSYFPKYGTVYYHFRHWSDCGILNEFLHKLVRLKRQGRGRSPEPTVAVIDSQSVRSGYPSSVKGVDGHKKIKGIKRQIAVDSDGRPLCISITPANVNDSKGGCELLDRLHRMYPSVALVKADKGYRGTLHSREVVLECVKSNFGTSDFVPLKGRWVVERTISWLDTYRRLCRNYERYLSSALSMTYLACIVMLLRE